MLTGIHPWRRVMWRVSAPVWLTLVLQAQTAPPIPTPPTGAAPSPGYASPGYAAPANPAPAYSAPAAPAAASMDRPVRVTPLPDVTTTLRSSTRSSSEAL